MSGRRMTAVLLGTWLLAGCATRATHAPTVRQDSVDQRMLPAAADGEAAGTAPSYRMGPAEVFRMPAPLETGNPQLPADSPRQTLAPTTVCARVILDAAGRVERAEALNDRADCAAGALGANADLMRATLERVGQWQFVPAAICHFAAPPRSPRTSGDCEGAERIEPVPVTLAFAFTFEVAQGRATVRGGDLGR